MGIEIMYIKIIHFKRNIIQINMKIHSNETFEMNRKK